MAQERKPSDTTPGVTRDQSPSDRADRQARQDPSGHGMQVPPAQQKELARSTDHSPNATGDGEDGGGTKTYIDEEVLDDLKGE